MKEENVKNTNTKYIFVTGGVVSGLGKGITAASLGRLLKARGYSVSVLKLNPYFNFDNSNLSADKHGEIFITEDGREGDLVLGHYERILGDNLTAQNDVTSGEIYLSVIENERKNQYGGATVQVVPHITDEIKKRILNVNNGADIVIVEVGGTVGDIEAEPYLEAVRQLKNDLGKFNTAFIHVSLVPFIDVSGEQKTKPTQNSVKELQNLGIQPDVVVCRSDFPLDASSRNKLALFCNVEKSSIIESMIASNIYEVPLRLEKEGLCNVVLKKLRLDERDADLAGWEALCKNIDINADAKHTINIGLAGKNVNRQDAHLSLREALKLSGVKEGIGINIVSIGQDVDASMYYNLDGLVVAEPDGEEEKSLGFNSAWGAVKYCRSKNIPVLMIAKAARFGTNGEAFIDGAQKGKPYCKKGLFKTNFKKGTLLHSIYGDSCCERHKHLCQFNPKFFKGNPEFIASGISEDGTIDAYELKEHKFFIGVIFNPELSFKPMHVNPLINAFVVASKGWLQICEDFNSAE